MFKVTSLSLAAVAVMFLFVSDATASQDEATNHFLEGVATMPRDSVAANGAGRGRSATFMIANTGNLTGFVVGCDDACRGVSVQIRAAGLPPIVAGSAVETPRTAMMTIPDSYRRAQSNFEVRITVDCANGRQCDYVWGALAEGRGQGSSVPTLTPAEWDGAGETLARSALRWVQRPTGDDMLFFYPVDAWQANVAGSAQLECVIIAGGQFRCRTASETPQGQGFGVAAVRLAALFRVEETDADGNSLVGRRVVLPIRFQPPA